MAEILFPLIVPIEVRFSDLDALGHVNNATYFSYFEIARIAYLGAILERSLTLGDMRLLIVEAACRYRSPALLGEVLHAAVRIIHMRRNTFAFEYLLRDGASGRLVAEGRTVQAAFDHQAGRMVPITEQFRIQIERLEGRTFNVREPIPPWGR